MTYLRFGLRAGVPLDQLHNKAFIDKMQAPFKDTSGASIWLWFALLLSAGGIKNPGRDEGVAGAP